MEQKIRESKKIGIYIICFFVGCLFMFSVVYFFPTTITENINKIEKDVTVTDTGIADAVEKIYDAVAVITTYKNESIISSGTGFIYSNTGNKYLLLTNYHVIENGDKVNATFTNGDIIETKIVGYNEYADIAVLSFESNHDYTVAELGTSENLRVGDTSFAVGAPLDNAYSWSVTRGIISGKDRMVEVSLGNSQISDYVMKVLQTDTAINSGNSGGPLCNSNGEVIGITSLKLVSNGIEGMGFAIPIESALNTAEKIINGDGFETPYLGISMYDISRVYYRPEYREVIEKAGITTGVIISDVEKKSPANIAGLEPMDIIVKINNEEVKNIAYLRHYLFTYNIGDTIKISFYRNGDLKTVDVTLRSNAATS
ncbi:MAG: PDZ domain-containing protein [Firmicutes bacterium]|nr:PDZ domain-containing protein [Bacillota bacterium]